jgi:hypothetical protein
MTPPLLVRFVATMFCTLRYPIVTLRAVPINWKNLVLGKDLLEEPEVVPGYLDAVSTGELTSDLRIPNVLRGFARRPVPRVFCDMGYGITLHFLMITLAVPIVVVLYVPYYSARWALKSTAVIWSPLLWVAAAANGSALPVRLRLKVLAEDATSKVVYLFSWSALTFVALLWLGLFQSDANSLGGFTFIAVCCRCRTHCNWTAPLCRSRTSDSFSTDRVVRVHYKSYQRGDLYTTAHCASFSHNAHKRTIETMRDGFQP